MLGIRHALSPEEENQQSKSYMVSVCAQEMFMRDISLTYFFSPHMITKNTGKANKSERNMLASEGGREHRFLFDRVGTISQNYLVS